MLSFPEKFAFSASGFKTKVADAMLVEGDRRIDVRKNTPCAPLYPDH
jgi:hypothetical protein